MMNADDPRPSPADPERALSLAYAPAGARDALAALWMLDEQLGAIVARTENPTVGQMRLTWWHDALQGLRTSRPIDPVLVALADASRIDPAGLLPLIDGWEVLLDPLPLPDEALAAYAAGRGGALFRVAAMLLGGSGENAGKAGRLWALTDLAFRISDQTTAERALVLARANAARARLPGPLAVLTALARRDLRQGLDRPRRQGSPARVMRAMIAGLTGR
jgi:phytoene synthase